MSSTSPADIARYLYNLLDIDDAENGPELDNVIVEYDGSMQFRLADGRLGFIRIDIEG